MVCNTYCFDQCRAKDDRFSAQNLKYFGDQFLLCYKDSLRRDLKRLVSIQQFFVISADLDSKYNNKQYYNSKKLSLKLTVIGRILHAWVWSVKS